MYFRKSNILHIPRLRLYKPRRRAPDGPAGQLLATRRRFGTNGRSPGFSEAGRRARYRADDARRRQSIRAAASVYQEILCGAAIGVVACLALVWMTGATPASLVAAAIWGSCCGALIGFLLWVGSAALPEDPVAPPSAEQARDGKPAGPTPRR